MDVLTCRLDQNQSEPLLLNSCTVIIYHTPGLIGASLSEPHTSESEGTSDRLQTITIKHGKLVYSSIDNLIYTENSRNGSLTIHHKTVTCVHHTKNNR